MSMTNRKWRWIGGAAAVAAPAFGVSAGTLLSVGFALLCPAAVFFGMRGESRVHPEAQGASG